MTVSDFGIDMIKAFEGFRPKVYRCPAGVPTQGYGHTAAAGPPALGGSWTKEYATEVLRKTVAKEYAAPVQDMLKRTATQPQFDAMVSLAYNIGVGAFSKSSVLRNFNRGQHAQAAAAFQMWNKAGGKVMEGLVRRRAAEALAYQGIKDLNFDGRRGPDEPVYGDMPQKVDRSRESIGATRTGKGAGTAAAGGAIIVAKEVQEKLQEAEGFWTAGTTVGLILGGIVVVGAAMALYARWDDAGRPLPAWFRRFVWSGGE